MKFSDKLKIAGFKTQRQFAKYARLTPNTLSNWNKGEPQHLATLHLDLLITLRKLTGDVEGKVIED